MSDSESDVENKSPLPSRAMKKPPPSPSEDVKNKKITTKMMIIDALVELKSRKGVSLYAIKKYLTEKYNVNTEKVNYLIKKSIKAGVEDGTFVQIKGIGAAGSFKLANVKEKPKKKKPEKKNKEKTDKAEKALKTKKVEKSSEKTEKRPEKTKENKMKNTEKKVNEKAKEITKEKKPKKKVETEKADKKKTENKKKKLKLTEGMQTPSKKRIMKRKSIGSIIKPPKMKPKLQV